ncbi:MAG: dienelactone hydrolase family protein [Saprospiraceae bacterium]|nr:dienelactone hydrolase family protein [Saprospiraceae bacterium]
MIRFRLICFSLLLALLAQAQQSRVPYSTEELQRRTFHFFWDLTDQNTQVPDRWPTVAFSSIAATGFGLSGYLVGVEHGWITREQAAERVLKTLRVLQELPQGDATEGTSGYRGFFYHFLDHQKSRRYRDVELSSIDSGLLLAGVLSCQTSFDGDNPTEKAIREAADFLYRRVEWDWMLNANNRLSMGWKPEFGFIQNEWFGYTEAMILYVLALGSPTHAIPAESWNAWCQNYFWDEFQGQPHVNFGPLFGHQYSHVWIDFRGIQDPYMRAKGMDYFENSRRATLTNRAYCLQNPHGHKAYAPNMWGLTACDGPVDWLAKNDPQRRCSEDWSRFRGYSARGAASDYEEDDGTLAPTAAGGSVPFAPEVCLPVLENMWNTYYDSLVGPYGFKDAFNPGFTGCGRLPAGWFDVDYLGIDQGPILLMLENQKNALIWELMKKNPYIRRGLLRAGFTGGWLDQAEKIAPGQALKAPNTEVPLHPRFFFERGVYRENAASALRYCLLRPGSGPASVAVPGFSLRANGKLSNRQGQEKKLPLVIFLHGSGERGYDNESQLRNGVQSFIEPDNFRKNPCFVLAPQCPQDLRWSGANFNLAATWSDTPTEPMRLLIQLIEKILQENPAIDRDRIYLTGLSMGGAGSFDLLMRKPEWFAAALPLCGGGDPQQASRIKNIPLWVLHGSRDEVSPPGRSRRIVQALKKMGAPVQYTEYATLGHSIWQETYYNPAVMKWLFAQKKTRK